MAGVRDPAFWKRFSVAVHMDEEQQGEKQRGGTHHGAKDAYVHSLSLSMNITISSEPPN
jgi:hypothetical protein